MSDKPLAVLSEETTGHNGEQRRVNTRPEAVLTEVDKGMATLYRKLAAVMSKIAPVEKTGKNTFHHYTFQTAEAIANAVRVILADEGIAFFVSMYDVNQTETQDSKGKKITLTTAKFDFTFACGETGATITHQWVGEALDNQDKGINKMATAATKYFLMKTFLISTPDEADTDGESNERPSNPTSKSKPKPQPKAETPEPTSTFEPGFIDALTKRVMFMYDLSGGDFHLRGSIQKAIAPETGYITPDDSGYDALLKIFFHRCKEDVGLDEPAVFKQLSLSVNETREFKDFTADWVHGLGRSVEDAWGVIQDYKANIDTPPAKPAKPTGKASPKA